MPNASRRETGWAVASFLAVVLAACSSSSAGGTASGGDDASGDDGSTAGCTSVGGVCQPFSMNCPIEQQNTALCGDSLLVCCLPPDGETLPNPPDGGGGDGATMDSTTVDSTAPKDSAPPKDTSQPPMDTSMPPKDTGSPGQDATGGDAAGD